MPARSNRLSGGDGQHPDPDQDLAKTCEDAALG
jgi:hypothetical protein